MFRSLEVSAMIRSILAYVVVSTFFASTSKANPCADVEWAQAAIVSGFTAVPTRKAPPLEHLTRPLFGDASCTVNKPRGFSTANSITCIHFDGTGTSASPTARQWFDNLSKTMSACLTQHNAFDNRANEQADDDIFERAYFRSYDGRETWSLTLSDKSDPTVYLTAEYETDTEKAQKKTSLPGFVQNVLAAQACELFKNMEALARSNFAGVDTKRVRTEWAMAKPIGGADQCLIARDQMRGENLIACQWINLTPDHAKWAAEMHAIRLTGARSCRRGWGETKKAYEVEFSAATGDKLSVGMQNGKDGSVSGVAIAVKIAP
jgi:hypothetical protein